MNSAREPRRRNLAETKARILRAAAEVFAEFGYRGSGLRDIAERANVAPSLVGRYFGSKAQLFEAALIHVLRTESVFTWRKSGFGEAMARMIPERTNAKISIMLVLALADPETQAIARRVSREHMIQPLIDWLGPPEAEERAMNMFALLTGFVIQMHGLHKGTIPEHSLRWLAGSLQAIVDGTDLRADCGP